MAIQTITYSDKQAMGTQPSIPDVNKVMDSDMNEIKTVVNGNATVMGSLGTVITVDFTEKTSTLPSGGWYSLGNVNVSETLEKATYLAIVTATLTPDGNNNGIATIELYVDTGRIGQISRSTIPIASSLTSTANSSVTLTFNSAGSHSFNVYCYGSVNYKVSHCQVRLIKVKEG